MRRSMFKSKIHRVKVTEANIDYEGSVTIDQDLMDAANMLPYEKIHIWDIDNGARLISYTLPGPRSSGTVCMNGAAARLVKPGDRVIMATFAEMEEEEAQNHKPVVVLVDKNNKLKTSSHQEKPFRLISS